MQLTTEEEDIEAAMQKKVGAAMAVRGGTESGPASVEVQLDQRALALKTGAENGIDCRCALGQRFSSDAKGGKSQAYAAMSREEKSEFRKRWCEGAYNEYVSILKEKAWTDEKIKRAKMKMISGRALIKREGIEAFQKYAEKCMNLGRPWVEWDPMWERWNYGDVEKEYENKFTATSKISIVTTGDRDESAKPAAGRGTIQRNNVEATADNDGAKRRRLNAKVPPVSDTGNGGTATPLKEVKKGNGNNRGKSPGDDKSVGQDASKLRAKLAATQAAARHLTEVIKSTPHDWEWANTKKLSEAVKSLNEFCQASEFTSQFTLTGPTQQFKTQYKADPITLRNEYKSYMDHGAPLVSALQVEVNRILAMQAADKKARSDAEKV